MIKILKRGNLNVKQITCDKCGSELEYDEITDTRIGRWSARRYIICPVCEKWLYL